MMQSVSCVWAAVSARCWASVGVLACRPARVSGVPLRVSRVWVMVSVRACGGVLVRRIRRSAVVWVLANCWAASMSGCRVLGSVVRVWVWYPAWCAVVR